MIAISLAAGMGTRMGEMTRDIPKCMLPFLGETLLSRHRKLFASFGIEHFVITGYQSHVINFPESHKIYNASYKTTNMVHSLFCARNLLQDAIGKQDVIVAYGDIIFEKDILKSIIQENAGDIQVCIDKAWKSYWTVRMDDPLSDLETLKINADGYLEELGKKTQRYEDIEGQYIGFFKISKDSIAKVIAIYDALERNNLYDGKTFEQMFMTSFLQILINSGLKLYPVPILGGWLEFDSINDYLLYESLYKSGELGKHYEPNN